jgi:hypothetical protein
MAKQRFPHRRRIALAAASSTVLNVAVLTATVMAPVQLAYGSVTHHGATHPGLVDLCSSGPVSTVQRFLAGVSASSANNAWAVGWSSSTTAVNDVTLHWNGSRWSCVHSPDPKDSQLTAVATTSSTNAWAVGLYDAPAGPLSPTAKVLMEHWNGHSWRRVSTPAVGSDAELNGVTALSAKDAWAVGSVGNFDTAAVRTLIEHWNGKSWKRVPSPSPRTGGLLQSVTATSAGNVWASGNASWEGSDADATGVIEHWNGSNWAMTSAPGDPALANCAFYGISASSAKNAWTVGIGPPGAVFERWNGASWTQVSGASPAHGDAISDVVFSGADAWAITDFRNKIERWNGKSWSFKHGPLTGSGDGTLFWSISGDSPKDIWLTGQTDNQLKFLIEHWNGKSWTRINHLPNLVP